MQLGEVKCLILFKIIHLTYLNLFIVYLEYHLSVTKGSSKAHDFYTGRNCGGGGT